MSDQTETEIDDDGLYPSSDLFNEEEFSDFKVKCQETVFHVLKVSLASASIVFRRMLTSPRFIECQKGELHMKNAHPKCVEAFLRYMYNKKPIEGYNNARGVIELAEKYQMSDLKDMCETILSTQVTSYRLIALLELAEKLKLKRLRRACFAFGYLNPDPLPNSVTLAAYLPIHYDSTLCIAHPSDYVVFDHPILSCEMLDSPYRITCTLKPGKEVNESMIVGRVDLYEVEINGRLTKYATGALYASRESVPLQNKSLGFPPSNEYECHFEHTFV